jgi:hypothetical protein
MLKRIFIFVLLGAMFFVGMQFLSVFFYAWEFEDFIKDELKFAVVREDDSKEHLTEHIKQQAQYYGLNINAKNILVEKSTDIDSGITTLSADVAYATPVNLFTSHISSAGMFMQSRGINRD